MKRFLICSTLAVAVALGGAAAYAQTGAPAAGPGQHQPATPEQRLQKMTEQLNLSNDQQQNIKLILDDESEQMQSLRSNTSLSQQERRSKMQEIRQNTKAQINSILTPEQQTQLQQAQAQQTQAQPSGRRPNTPQPQ